MHIKLTGIIWSNGERNNPHNIKGMKDNWSGHVMRTNCPLKHVIKGKIKWMWRRWRRRQRLPNDLKENRRYRNLIEPEKTSRKTDYAMNAPKWQSMEVIAFLINTWCIWFPGSSLLTGLCRGCPPYLHTNDRIVPPGQSASFLYCIYIIQHLLVWTTTTYP